MTNLLSLCQLQENGYEILIKNGVRQIQNDDLSFNAQAKMSTNKIFSLYLNNIQQSYLSLK